MPEVNSHRWYQIGLFNLILVALFGLLMRIKLAFDFPFFEQRFLLHAHSHFAFSGWISHLLYLCLPALLAKYADRIRLNKYHWLVIINLVSAYGMLIAFTIQGYKAVSITFSTLSLTVGMLYAWWFIRDCWRTSATDPAVRWAVAALLAGVISSLGPFTLAWLMATKQNDSVFYSGAVYFYLHFQYNGWFFFGIMALMIHYFKLGTAFNRSFILFAITLIPTVVLSFMWMELPFPLWLLVAMAAGVQMIAGTWLTKDLIQIYQRRKESIKNFPNWVRWAFTGALLAVFLKFILQTLSVIPQLSQLVFAFRPIVIAYLHLVLLAGFTLFFIGFMAVKGHLPWTKLSKWGFFVFLIGVLLNELVLTLEGLTALRGWFVGNTQNWLVVAAVLLFWGSISLFSSQVKRQA